jgi:hypothetical protein
MSRPCRQTSALAYAPRRRIARGKGSETGTGVAVAADLEPRFGPIESLEDVQQITDLVPRDERAGVEDRNLLGGPFRQRRGGVFIFDRIEVLDDAARMLEDRVALGRQANTA